VSIFRKDSDDEEVTTYVYMEILVCPTRHLTGECFNIQFRGREACERCKDKDTERCTGEAIRATGRNALGFPVPMAERVS